MMYPFITLADGTLITHSHLLGDGDNKAVEVHFERPSANCFDTARCRLPSYEWILRDGYSDDEITLFEKMLHDGADVFFKYAELGGMSVAKAV